MKRFIKKTFCMVLSCGLIISPIVPMQQVIAEENTGKPVQTSSSDDADMDYISPDGDIVLEAEDEIFSQEEESEEEFFYEDSYSISQLSEASEISEDAEVVYQISSQQDWDNLVHGISDSANWTDGCYTGTENFSIVLNCDMVSDTDTIKMTNDVVCNFNLNGYELSSVTGAFGIKTVDNNGNYTSNSGTVIIYNGMVSQTQFDCSFGLSNLIVHNIEFVDCTAIAVNARQISKSISITDCTITHVERDNTDTAIICSYACNNGNRLIQDITISGFDTGIDGTYSSVQGTDVFQQIIMEGVNTGINLDYGSNGAKIIDCELMGTKRSGSQGIRMMPSGTSKVQFALTDRVNSYIDNCSISGFDTGIYCYFGTASVYNSKITDVNHGMYADSGALCAKDSIITANEQVSGESYTGDSYGVYAPTTGFCIINTDISGFKVGAYNNTSDGFVGNSIFDNINCNVKGQCNVIYNCLLKNATVSVYLQSATMDVIDTTIIGNNTSGSIGAYDYNGANFKLIGTSDDYPLESLNLSFGYQDVAIKIRDSYENRSYDMLIQDYDIGAKTVSNFIECHNFEVSDCNTGLSGGTFHFGNASNTVNTPVYIHDCANGIISGVNFVNSSDVYIYDCDETGLTVNTQLSGNTYRSDLKIEVYNCRTGMVLNGIITGPHLVSHDNKNNGIQLKGNNTSLYTSVLAYDNDDWNMYCDGIQNCYFLNSNSQINQLTNGTIGNLYINAKNPSAMSVAITGDNMTSDNSTIYLEDGNTLYILPKSSVAWKYPTDWLQGTMTFDVPDENYIEGTPVVSTASSYVHNEYDQFGNMENLFVRSHFFADREGWIIDWTDESRGVSGDSQLVLAEGCNVTYDYVTNGGTEIVSSFPMNEQNRISYRKDNPVDLSLSAVRDGYEFIGWNTNPNAHEGLEILTAGVKDITLYAIYRKEVTYNYHTYDSALDFTQSGYHFNNEIRHYADKAGMNVITAVKYSNMVSGSKYVFAGYTYQSDDTERMFTEGTELSSTFDIYCLYYAKSVLSYYTPKSVLYKQEVLDEICTAADVVNHMFYYNVIRFQPERGYSFQWWKDSDSNIYEENVVFVTWKSENNLFAEIRQIYVDSIIVTPKEVDIEIGETKQLEVIVNPDDALDTSVTWSSSDLNIATIDENGLVTAVGTGTVIITATANDGSGCSDYAIVTIKEPPQQEASAPDTGIGPVTPVGPKTGDDISIASACILGFLSFLGLFAGTIFLKRKH